MWGRESGDSGKGRLMEPSLHYGLYTGSLLRYDESPKKEATWGWYELLLFDIYRVYALKSLSVLFSQ